MSSHSISSELLPLFEFSKVVNASHDLEFLLATVLRTLMGKMLVGKGLVMSRREGTTFRVQFVRGVPEETVGRTIEIARPPRSTVDLKRRSSHAWARSLLELGQVVLLPILSRKELVGYLALGKRLNGSPFRPDDRALLESIVGLSGSAIEKAMIIGQVHEANRNLDRKVQELNTLFDLSKEFNIGLDLQKILRLITFALMGQVGVRQYAVCLRKDDRLEIAVSRMDAPDNLDRILGSFCDIAAPSKMTDLLKQKNCRAAAAELLHLGLHVVIPMHIQGKTKGLLLLGERLRGGPYMQADLEFLYALGNLAIISIENARLFQDAIERQRLEDELMIAREIQQGLLPEFLPNVPGYDIAAINIPSKQVGGDYYDVLVRNEKEVVLAVGDVSGKGTPAALLMANVQAALRALAPVDQSASIITGRINDITAANTRGGSKFITFIWGVLDHTSHILTYVNAGHNPPMLLRKSGKTERLDKGGLILGIYKTTKAYEEASVKLEKGDVLVLFTDGISEAMNALEEDFTEERLLAILETVRDATSSVIIDTVLRSIQEHVKSTPQSDDITMLVVRRT